MVQLDNSVGLSGLIRLNFHATKVCKLNYIPNNSFALFAYLMFLHSYKGLFIVGVVCGSVRSVRFGSVYGLWFMVYGLQPFAAVCGLDPTSVGRGVVWFLYKGIDRPIYNNVDPPYI